MAGSESASRCGAYDVLRFRLWRTAMLDVAMLVMTGGFFAVGMLYVLACERL
jgi:hypothetical protein